MEGAVIAGFSTLAFLIILQLIFFAYGYGRLNQKMSDTCDKVDTIWKKVFNGGSKA